MLSTSSRRSNGNDKLLDQSHQEEGGAVDTVIAITCSMQGRRWEGGVLEEGWEGEGGVVL
jgi:hypothetical protein